MKKEGEKGGLRDWGIKGLKEWKIEKIFLHFSVSGFLLSTFHSQLSTFLPFSCIAVRP